ncbi:MAG: alcohol dehydrogenase catalytic domain-containing protein [Chloroflexi bacterium]|nr:alcohol dehydrogenase catalytic domain-containing protein [Chloroflexota bacterium]
MGQAVVFDGTGVRVIGRETPSLQLDEALIQLKVAGVCSTDLALTRGYMNFEGVLGHEFAGEVVQGPEEWVGQRVVGEINIACGQCDLCRMGIPTQCRNRSTLGISGNYDGAFADEFKLVVRNLHRIPDNVTDIEAVFAEPLAAACEILQQVHLRPTEPIYILGVGRLGMLCAQVMHQAGMPVIGIVRHDRQVELLAKWGIEARWREEVPNARAGVVVDCTGNAAGFEDVLALVRPRGTVVLKSTYEGIPQANLSKIVVNEIAVVGSRCGPFDVALRLLSQKQIDVLSMIDGEYSLSDAPAALARAAQGGVLKLLLRP